MSVAAVAVATCLSLPGCSDSSAPRALSGGSCPTAGPVRSSELASLAPCELKPGTEIVIDVWPGTTSATPATQVSETAGPVTPPASGLDVPAGSVQNVGECAGSSEGIPVTVCTFGPPVGTGGFAGDVGQRVWFGSPEAVARVKAGLS